MAITVPHEGFLTLLKKENFLRLWLAQLISMTIFNASNYALLVLIEEVTGSTTLVGLAIICFSLPALILGAPATVVGWVCQCGRGLEFLEATGTCADCGLEFLREANGISLKQAEPVSA